jgi:hypothetical protein
LPFHRCKQIFVTYINFYFVTLCLLLIKSEAFKHTCTYVLWLEVHSYICNWNYIIFSNNVP